MADDEYLKRCFEILTDEGLLSCPPPPSPTFCSCSLDAYRTPLPSAAPQACYMLNPKDFPPLETVRDPQSRVTASPYVKQNTMLPTGNLASLSSSEEVLNWQTSNAIVQNQYLKNIDGKLNQALTKTNRLDSKVSFLH
ncbi:hypothetical protein JCGZ_19415 [Jatropha curcas]|uniref:Uncharacterized protein n=1 Tax=Jatropha curcas TaxID=180498 RepID=A0A067KAN9_JATCU|nr:hypothetical protein JCGZ_19415 [Jatropha curcas]